MKNSRPIKSSSCFWLRENEQNQTIQFFDKDERMKIFLMRNELILSRTVFQLFKKEYENSMTIQWVNFLLSLSPHFHCLLFVLFEVLWALSLHFIKLLMDLYWSKVTSVHFTLHEVEHQLFSIVPNCLKIENKSQPQFLFISTLSWVKCWTANMLNQKQSNKFWSLEIMEFITLSFRMLKAISIDANVDPARIISRGKKSPDRPGYFLIEWSVC